MLTAYNYYEPEEEQRIRKGIKESKFFKQELTLAAQFSLAHAGIKNVNRCLVCDSDYIKPFFQKWDIQYYRCEHCYSIFAGVNADYSREYLALTELANLRKSDEYQAEGELNRKQRWEELIDWLKFRIFRYRHTSEGLSVIDYGNRWRCLRSMLTNCGLFANYEAKDSLRSDADGKADIILAMDFLQGIIEPQLFFRRAYEELKVGGLLFLGTKAGSGLDVLLLRGNNRNVFPYEHVMLPSKEGLKILLDKANFKLLEFTTPGTFDCNYVQANKDGLGSEEYFMRYFLDTATPGMENEFQRFIQKAGLSSYAQIVAMKEG